MSEIAKESLAFCGRKKQIIKLTQRAQHSGSLFYRHSALCVRYYYFTIPFSRYSSRFTRTRAAASSAATFFMSESTISLTSSSKVV